MDAFVTVFVNVILVLFVILIAYSSIKIIRQASVGIVERLGKYHKSAEQGINMLIPFVDSFRAIVDLREQVVSFAPQPVITKDNVTMMIDTVVYYQVTDAFRFVYEIQNPIFAIDNLTATTLRNIVGDLELDETLTSRDLVNTKLRSILDEATDKWGIKVNRVELKTFSHPKIFRALWRNRCGRSAKTPGHPTGRRTEDRCHIGSGGTEASQYP